MGIPRKPQPGAPFRGSPPTSAQWVADVTDAMHEYKLRRRLGTGLEPPHVEHYGHKIRCKLASGGPYPIGTPLEVGASLFTEVSREKDWHACSLRSGHRTIGIALEPARTTSATWVQLDGICPALVNVLDVEHTHAWVEHSGSQLTSDFGGPIELITVPADTGSQTLLVRLASPLLFRKAKAEADISAGSSGDVSIWINSVNKGEVTAYLNWMDSAVSTIPTGTELLVEWCDDERKWIIVGWECTA